MNRFIVALLLVLASSVGASEDPTPRILLVVDASATMSSPFGQGGASRIGSVRATLDLLAALVEETRDQPEFAVRIFGGGRGLTDPDACGDTELLRPWAPLSDEGLDAVLDGVTPRGPSPLAAALEAAAEDLGEPRPGDLVIAVVDSLDTCGGDVSRALGRLLAEGKGAEVHVVGPGLVAQDQAFFAATSAAFHRAGWPSQFKGVFLGAVSRRFPLSREQLPVPLQPLSGSSLPFEPATLSFVLPDSSEALPVDLETTTRTPPTAPESATVIVAGAEEGETLTFVRTAVRPGKMLDLDPTGTTGASLDLGYPLVAWGEQPVVEASWAGAPSGPLRLVLSREGAPGASWIEAREVEGPSGTATLPLPESPNPAVVQLRQRRSLNTVVLAERDLAMEGRRIVLEAPSSLIEGSSVAPTWDGDVVEGDFVTLVSATDPEETVGPTLSAVEDLGGDLGFPLSPCTWELRYISGSTSRVLASRTLEVSRVDAGLLAADSVAAGAEFPVHWWGPKNLSDAITLAPVDGSPGEYLSWHDIERGSPAGLRAPTEPGSYEVRYWSDRDGILATREVVVEASPITITAPAQVTAGRRFPFSWQGPNGVDDFLVLIEAGGRLNNHLDFTFATTGSPTTFAAPREPGSYQILYVTVNPRRILATADITVVE